MTRRKVDEEEHLELYGGLREGIGMKVYLHDRMDAANHLELRFRVWGIWTCRKGERDIRVPEGRRNKIHRIVHVAKQ